MSCRQNVLYILIAGFIIHTWWYHHKCVADFHIKSVFSCGCWGFESIGDFLFGCVWYFHGWLHIPVKPCLLRWDRSSCRITACTQPVKALFCLNEENIVYVCLKAVTWCQGGGGKSLPEMIIVTVCVLCFFSVSLSHVTASHRVWIWELFRCWCR